jgi:hypothetical protein
VLFDTVFSTVGSATQYLRVKNPYNRTLKLSKVALASGNDSPYRINIDGLDGPVQEDVEILPNDSIFIFVELTVDPNNDNLPFLVPDSIRFEVNGNVYTHLGRADMFRIREMAIEAKWFLSLCRNLKIDGELVFDSVKQKIYYADWGSGIVDDNVAKLNNELDSKYGVSISSWKVLRHQDYIYGVKVDHPLLRETFNNS